MSKTEKTPGQVELTRALKALRLYFIHLHRRVLRRRQSAAELTGQQGGSGSRATG